MAYDESKAITLGQAVTIAKAAKTSALSDAAATDVSYTNYEYTTVQEALDDLLYTAISITAFSNTVGTVELGTTVDSCTFNWTTNKTPSSITLAGTAIDDVTATTATLTSMGLTKTAAGSQSYKLVVTDERDASANKTTYIYFYNGVYYGVGDTDTVDSAFVLSMTKTLLNKLANSFTVTAGSGQYIYYAIPARLGTPTFYVGGFEGGFNLDATIDFTNASGFTESYSVYKSTNANLGSTTVTVS